jgi:CBS-domain-containing membrane protein
MNIADIATNEYIEVDAETRLGKIRSLFEQKNLKGLVVVQDGEYAGIITQTQLLQSHVKDDAKAAGLTRTAPQVERTADIREVARLLVESSVKIAPVFEADRLWGIVTADAILEAVLENLDAIDVGDILTEDVVTVETDAHVGRAISLLRENGISRLPVVDDQNSLVGIVTTYDIIDVVVRRMDKPTRGDRSGDTDSVLDMPVSDVMSSPVETVPATATVRAAVEPMLTNDYGGAVVTPVDDDRQVAGVITKTDVLRALSYTEREQMDVQVTNVSLLDSLTRETIREEVASVSDKYQKMRVRHAHVRFHEHKEQLRGTPLMQCQIRLRTNRGQVAGTGEGYGASQAFRVAMDKLERRVLEIKGIPADEEYRGQLLRKLGEL